jgi:hypothetical protein
VLCSFSSGHAIDVEGDNLACAKMDKRVDSPSMLPTDGTLVLRHRRPVLFPYPNAYSHSLPQFTYSPETGHIKVIFEDNPAFPPSSSTPSTAWREKEYLLTSIPIGKPPSLFESATRLVTSTASALTSPFLASTSAIDPDESFDLRQEEILEEERAETQEDDDSPEIGRRVRVIALPKRWTELKGGSSPNARERRRWEIVPLILRKIKTSTTAT